MTAPGRADERREPRELRERLPLRARVQRWGARELVTGWVAYWLGLLLYSFWPQIEEYYRLATGPAGHGTVSWSYTGSALAAALWIAGPPLLMAVAWIVTRPRRP